MRLIETGSEHSMLMGKARETVVALRSAARVPAGTRYSSLLAIDPEG
jgi:hypothetical protein